MNGISFAAGTTTVSREWTTVDFGYKFQAVPVVFSTVMTVKDSATVITRQKVTRVDTF